MHAWEVWLRWYLLYIYYIAIMWTPVMLLRPQLQVALVLPLGKWAGEGAVSVFSCTLSMALAYVEITISGFERLRIGLGRTYHYSSVKWAMVVDND